MLLILWMTDYPGLNKSTYGLFIFAQIQKKGSPQVAGSPVWKKSWVCVRECVVTVVEAFGIAQ